MTLNQVTITPLNRPYLSAWTRRDSSANPWVVFVHGLASEWTENGLFPPLMESMARTGFNVISYDWRGLGASHGDFASSSLKDHVADLKSVVEWLSASGHGNPPVHLLGFSLGCAIIALYSRTTDRPIASCIYLSPALRLRQCMWPRYTTANYREQLERTGVLIKAENGVKIGRQMIDEFWQSDLADSAFRTDLPYLLCHGTNDERVPVTLTRELVGRHRGKRLRFKYFDNATHSFRPEFEHRTKLNRYIMSWLNGGYRMAPPTPRQAGPEANQVELEIVSGAHS